MPLQIAIVDDHALFRKGLARLLADGPEFEVLFEAENGAALMDRLATGPFPDVILLDISMPVMDGITALKAIRQAKLEAKVLMLTMNQDDAMILHVMELGANGYLLKESGPEEVEMAIRSVMENGFYFTERTSRAMLRKLVAGEKLKPTFAGMIALSDREMEVLELVCRGRTNPEIADQLFLSPRTVEGHRKNMMEKMGVHNTAGLIVYAIKKGWVDLDDILI